jgi:hypothetical protein
MSSYGNISKGFCHKNSPIPQVVSIAEQTEIVVVFPTINLPNFCLEHVYDETKIIPPPPPSVTL